VPVYTSLGELLKDLARREGLTAAALAERSGMKVRTVNSYLQGERGLPAKTALPLFRAVGWDEETFRKVAVQIALPGGLTVVERPGQSVDFIARLEDGAMALVEAKSSRPALPRAFRDMAHEIEREAHRLGASVEDMDYVRASLTDPDTMVSLLEDPDLNRPLTEEEQHEELEALKDELLAWVKRRIQLREKRRRRG
jgi:transcriptional regulator with XRE-family HTH domain